MKIGTASGTYNILAFDEDMVLVDCDENPCIQVDQYKGDKLEIWKTRADGFLFVYCNRLEIGYWVKPVHITLDN